MANELIKVDEVENHFELKDFVVEVTETKLRSFVVRKVVDKDAAKAYVDFLYVHGYEEMCGEPMKPSWTMGLVSEAADPVVVSKCENCRGEGSFGGGSALPDGCQFGHVECPKCHGVGVLIEEDAEDDTAVCGQG